MMMIDSHAHVFERGLPAASVHRYLPGYDATLADYLSLLNRFEISSGVLIQPSFLGSDNSYLVAALAKWPDRLRGIAVIDPKGDISIMDELNRHCCVGFRLNLFGLPDPQLKRPEWTHVIKKARDLGWHAEIHAEAHRLPELVGVLIDAGLQVVIDHFGRPDPTLGVKDPGFQYLLKASASRDIWITISGAYRNGENGRGEEIAMEAIPLLKQTFGLDRMIWGSDWPFTQFETQESYATVLSFLHRMLPDATERQAVVENTPALLYKFNKEVIR
jgi:predicted TIM-barrel fold metal-dependent hydrolase